jgi:hypothetical protein
MITLHISLSSTINTFGGELFFIHYFPMGVAALADF